MNDPIIVSDLALMMGKPVIAGTRITADLILEKMANGETIEQIVEAHPRLTRQCVLAGLDFASRVPDSRARPQLTVNPRLHYTVRSVVAPACELGRSARAGGRMSDRLPPLPPYPKGPESELPLVRWDWGEVMWTGFAVVMAVIFRAILQSPGWCVLLVPGLLPLLAVTLAVCGLVLLAVFACAEQRSGSAEGRPN